jgi:hypothetical protein
VNAVEASEFRELLEAERERVLAALAQMREDGQRTMELLARPSATLCIEDQRLADRG